MRISRLVHALLAAVAVLTLLSVRAPVEASGLELDAIVKAGLEGDTNPRRLNGEGSEFDTVERIFVGLNTASTSLNQIVEGSVLMGAKYFNNTEDENTLVVDGAGSFQRRLWQSLSFYLRGNARNRAERGHIRDYVRIGVRTGLTVRPSRFGISAGPVLGYFLYRPDSDVSYSAAGVSSQLFWNATDTFSLSTNYSFASRQYRQKRLYENEDGDLRPAEDARQDKDHVVGLSASYHGVFVAGIDLLYQRNLSNSFGKAYSRLTGRASGTVGLMWGLVMTAQVLVQRTSFDDEVLIDPTFRIDEENRNHVIINLNGPITDWLRWELRYSFYTQAFGGDDEDYSRHLMYGGLVAESRG